MSGKPKRVHVAQGNPKSAWPEIVLAVEPALLIEIAAFQHDLQIPTRAAAIRRLLKKGLLRETGLPHQGSPG